MKLQVLVNHVGYELGGPKRFVCRSEENLGPSGRYEVIDATDRVLMEGTASRLEPAARGGPWHYRGDFSAFREAGGEFQVRFEAAGTATASRRFGVGSSILRRLTMPLVLQFLRSRRFARENYRGADEWTPPGVLSDDEHFYDVGGGWFDVPTVAEASMRTGARATWALFLAHAHGAAQYLQALSIKSLSGDKRELSIELRELRRGADWLRRLMIRYPKSGVMISAVRPRGRIVPLGPGSHVEAHLSLLMGFLAAKVSEALADDDLLRRGELFWVEYQDGLGGIDTREGVSAMLLSETALHVATLEPRYLASAERRVKALLGEVEAEGELGERGLAAWETRGISMPAAALAEFAGSFPENPFTPRAKEAVGRFLEARVEAAKRDPFGLVPYDNSGTKDVAEEDVATLRAGEAWLCLAAYRVTGRPAYIELATNAMNWILGLNAEDACLLVGAGARGRQSWAPPPDETASDETMGAVLGSPGSEAASAHTAAAAAYLMALALI